MAHTFPLTELTFTKRQAVCVINESFTLVRFVSKTINNSDAQHSLKSHVTVTTVLALATLGSATINRNDPISVMPLKVAKASTNVLLLPVIVASIMGLTFTIVKTAYSVYFMRCPWPAPSH